MISDSEIKDFENAVGYLDDADQLYKWKKYFHDVIIHYDEMKEKEQKYVDEYISFIKPVFKIKPVLISIASFLLMCVSCLYFNNFKSINLSSFFLNLLDCFYAFLDGVDGSLSTVDAAVMFVSSFAATALIISTIYNIYMIVKYFIRSVRLGTEKYKVEKYLKDQQKFASKENAFRMTTEIEETIPKIKYILDDTLDKYCLDKRIVNRENLPQLLKLMKLNRDNSIAELQKYMFQNDMCLEHTADYLWGEALLMYDPNFIFYSKSNPWIDAEKKRRDKIYSRLATIVAFPLLISFGPLILLFMFAKDESKKKMKANDIRMRLQEFDPQKHSEELYAISGGNPESKSGYVDSSGMWRNAGEGYVDASGMWREPGEGYVDASGTWRESGEGYVDASGMWREPGEGYVDASGVWRE